MRRCGSQVGLRRSYGEGPEGSSGNGDASIPSEEGVVSIVWDPETDVSNALDEVAEVSPRDLVAARARLTAACRRVAYRGRARLGDVGYRGIGC
jgi:hypothetical protein